jgi:hypothetical protein
MSAGNRRQRAEERTRNWLYGHWFVTYMSSIARRLLMEDCVAGTDWAKVRKIEQERIPSCEQLRQWGLIR